jgi:hypothetical protein
MTNGYIRRSIEIARKPSGPFTVSPPMSIFGKQQFGDVRREYCAGLYTGVSKVNATDILCE